MLCPLECMFLLPTRTLVHYRPQVITVSKYNDQADDSVLYSQFRTDIGTYGIEWKKLLCDYKTSWEKIVIMIYNLSHPPVTVSSLNCLNRMSDAWINTMILARRCLSSRPLFIFQWDKNENKGTNNRKTTTRNGTLPPRWPSGKESASRAEDPGFESRLRRDFFGVESYQWLKNWHSSGYPARRLAL